MRRIVPAAAFALLASACHQQQKPPAPPPPQVTVGTPLQRDVVDWDEYVGRFEAPHSGCDGNARAINGELSLSIFFKQWPGRARRAAPLFDHRSPSLPGAAYQQAVAQNRPRHRATLTNAQQRARSRKDRPGTSRNLQAVSTGRVRGQPGQRSARPRADAARRNRAMPTGRRQAQSVDFTIGPRSRIGPRVEPTNACQPRGSVVTAQSTTELTTVVVTVDPIWFTFEGAESLYLKYVAPGSAEGRARFVALYRQSGSRWSSPTRPAFLTRAGWCSSTARLTSALGHDPAPMRSCANHDRLLTPGMFGRARLLGSGTYHAMLIPDEAIVDRSDAQARLRDRSRWQGCGARWWIPGPLVAGSSG